MISGTSSGSTYSLLSFCECTKTHDHAALCSWKQSAVDPEAGHSQASQLDSFRYSLGTLSVLFGSLQLGSAQFKQNPRLVDCLEKTTDGKIKYYT